MPRFAAIDVGSNAMRLRIIDATGPSVRPLDFTKIDATAGNNDREAASQGRKEITTLRASVRLGSEVFLTGRLTPSSISQACDALRSFRQAMDDAEVSAYRAVATSAVREAKNGSTLVERARREAGIELDVIEGIEEARLIQLAVNHRLPTAGKRLLLVDVGGGSTELTLLDDGKHTFSISLPLGTVRLLEAYVQGAGTLDAERIKLLEESIDRGLVEARPYLEEADVDAILGTGGNIETLLELCPQKGGYAGYPRAIDVRAMAALFRQLSVLSPNERRDQFNLRPDRADTIIPATVIFLRIAQALAQPAIVAPGVGLAAGVLEELVDRYFDVWDEAGETASILQACRRLGERYHYDAAHADLVAEFSTTLFDDLAPLHRFSPRDKLLLRAAALLHDIGDFVHYNGHHKHSYYLIQHADIIGLRPEERAIVANIARYHRKSAPDPSHPNYRELDKVARGKVSALAAILRIADALDREHCGKITGVRATLDRGAGTISLKLDGRADCELEEWTVKAKSGLLRDVYDLDVVIEK